MKLVAKRDKRGPVLRDAKWQKESNSSDPNSNVDLCTETAWHELLVAA